MKQRRRLDQVGQRLSRQSLRVLRERGIIVQSAVSLEHQHLAMRYVVRGVESSDAVKDLGRYVTLAQLDGRPVECLHPVEAIGVNRLHAIVIAPALVRIELLRTRRTCELLITNIGLVNRSTASGPPWKRRSYSRRSRSLGIGFSPKGQEPRR
jgi:hypothetical protein